MPPFPLDLGDEERGNHPESASHSFFEHHAERTIKTKAEQPDLLESAPFSRKLVFPTQKSTVYEQSLGNCSGSNQFSDIPCGQELGSGHHSSLP